MSDIFKELDQRYLECEDGEDPIRIYPDEWRKLRAALEACERERDIALTAVEMIANKRVAVNSLKVAEEALRMIRAGRQALKGGGEGEAQ